jgi:WD40 repeat protein
VAFSSDGQILASGSNDHTIKLWDTKTGAELQTLKGHVDWVRSVAYSNDGQIVCLYYRKQVDDLGIVPPASDGSEVVAGRNPTLLSHSFLHVLLLSKHFR